MGRPVRRGGPLGRLLAHAGLWLLVAILGGVTVFVAAAAGPVTTQIEDRALRQAVEQAPAGVRDLTLHWSRFIQEQPGSAIEAQQLAGHRMPADLRHEDAPVWGVRYTRLLALAGDGAASEPDGWAPVVNVVHQTGLADEVSLVEGAPPASVGQVEVMAAAAVADALGLRVGQDYALASDPSLGAGMDTMRPRAVVTSRHQLTVRLVGVFEADDPRAPAWETRRELLEPFLTGVPGEPPELTLRAAIVTDEAGMGAIYGHESAIHLEPRTLVRVRLDPDQLDTAWAARADQALAQLRTSPLTSGLTVQTGLDGLVDDFNRQAAASRAVMAVVAAGIIACCIGLLVLAARLALARRHPELVLLRARGASVAGLGLRLGGEAALLVVPAVAAAWLLQWLLVPQPGPVSPGALAGAVLVALVAVLVVPVVAALAHRQVRLAEPRGDIAARKPGPGRLTLELCLVSLAALGVWLVHWRGLSLAGVDPYLSAVPALIGVAAGLLALRLYRWPLLALSALTRRWGVVSYLGLARAGRAAPVAALPVVVLVLAVAVGSFAGTLQSGVAAARDSASLAAVGAHGHVTAGLDSTLSPSAVTDVARLPGVSEVAASQRGITRTGVPIGTSVQAHAVDAASYQQVLDEAGAVGLPAEFLAAPRPGEPIPALASPHLADYGPLWVSFDGVDYPVTLVGDVRALPGPTRGSDVVLVPREAVAAAAVDTLWIAGTSVDADALRQVVGADATVTTVTEWRAELDDSAFNTMFTVVFVAGTAAAVAAALLVVALAMVMQAPARGRAVSLLRTMGMSTRQARGLLLVELLPLTVLAVLIGGAAGMALPLLLGPALGLTEYTGGVAIGLHLEPAVVGGFAGLVVVLMAAGVMAQAAANRRLGLGGVLRVQG